MTLSDHLTAAVPVIYLTVAALQLCAFTAALVALLRDPPGERLAYRGLMRTAISRVALGWCYVATGVVLVAVPGAPKWSGLIAFTVAPIVWTVNSRLDVRLKRRLRSSPTP